METAAIVLAILSLALATLAIRAWGRERARVDLFRARWRERCRRDWREVVR